MKSKKQRLVECQHIIAHLDRKVKFWMAVADKAAREASVVEACRLLKRANGVIEGRWNGHYLDGEFIQPNKGVEATNDG